MASCSSFILRGGSAGLCLIMPEILPSSVVEARGGHHSPAIAVGDNGPHEDHILSVGKSGIFGQDGLYSF